MRRPVIRRQRRARLRHRSGPLRPRRPRRIKQIPAPGITARCKRTSARHHVRRRKPHRDARRTRRMRLTQLARPIRRNPLRLQRHRRRKLRARLARRAKTARATSVRRNMHPMLRRRRPPQHPHRRSMHLHRQRRPMYRLHQRRPPHQRHPSHPQPLHRLTQTHRPRQLQPRRRRQPRTITTWAMARRRARSPVLPHTQPMHPKARSSHYRHRATCDTRAFTTACKTRPVRFTGRLTDRRIK